MNNNHEIIIKNQFDIEQMRISGKLAAEVLDFITPYVVPGVSTNELDKLCHDFIVNVQEAYPSPLNYVNGSNVMPYPKSICTSVNNEICHGIPSPRILKDGDIINIDVTVYKNSYHGDTSRMFCVGNTTQHARRLCQVTFECLWLGIEQVKPGNYLGDIGFAIQNHAQNNGYSVVREFCGHGIGKIFHEDLQILHYGRPKSGIKIVPGMIFTIEPMINQGRKEVRFLSDGWTAVTKDRSLSAQWEHTILVTDNGYEVLTISPKMPPQPQSANR
ncbi:MAG: methionine aminopeptidase type [Burkholderiales bacterium]|jgi:methionyl aminopeptidase|nr:methionine aminopeptidase type [Burkholderiales bacterium]MCE3267974.1 methionine aminopeptidase type [Burkholderiales bacterium]